MLSKRSGCFVTFLYPIRNDIVNRPGFLRLFDAMPLFMTGPQIKKQ